MTGMVLAALVALVLSGGMALAWRTRRPQSPPAPPPAAPDRPLTPQEVAALRAIKPCDFCGGIHHGLCGRVTRVWYYPNGAVKQAILQDEWSTERTIWPESLPDEV
jgi:hypothetical protein